MNVVDDLDLAEIIATSIRDAIAAAMPEREALLRVIYNAHYDGMVAAAGGVPPRA